MTGIDFTVFPDAQMRQLVNMHEAHIAAISKLQECTDELYIGESNQNLILKDLHNRIDVLVENMETDKLFQDIPEKIVLYTDGGLREDHGYGSYHFEDVYETVEFGEVTSNEAEYLALLAGIQAVLETSGAQELVIKTDSQLMVRQLDGRYAVKAPHLRKLWRKARSLLAEFPKWTVTHIPRREVELVLGH